MARGQRTTILFCSPFDVFLPRRLPTNVFMEGQPLCAAAAASLTFTGGRGGDHSRRTRGNQGSALAVHYSFD